MSQRSVERVLGKLITDEGFRRDFLGDPARAAGCAGLDLSPAELDALSRVSSAELERLGSRLDDRICRLHVAPEPEGDGNPSRRSQG